MVYVTGDLHADIERLKTSAIKKLKRGDTLIVLGDFGFLWEGTKQEKKLLKWMGKRRYHLLFIEGTHDNYQLLQQYPCEEYRGGNARVISGRLRQLMRGECFTIEGKTLFCFGGGESDEVEGKNEGITWWKEELATPEEMAHASEILAAKNWQVDYILTHEGPGKLVRFVDLEKTEVNGTSHYLDEVMEKTQYKRWIFAAYHKDLRIGLKAAIVYKNIMALVD